MCHRLTLIHVRPCVWLLGFGHAHQSLGSMGSICCYTLDLLDAARHRFGCRIIERLIEQGPCPRITKLMDDILVDAPQLCQHKFGIVLKTFDILFLI